jgi:hypothetical protein
MAPRYVWTYDVGDLVHGGTKARNDCSKIAEQAGWTRFDTTLSGPPLARLIGLGRALARLARVDRSSVFLIQTPIHSGVGNNFIAYLMAIFFKTFTIVHDIDDLRGGRSNASERINQISHSLIYSGKLSQHIKKQKNRIRFYTPLAMWDYIIPDEIDLTDCHRSGPIIFAGNLTPHKVMWLYDRAIIRPALLLYGTNHDASRDTGKGDRYISSFDTNAPSFEGPVGWGLVWDGAKTGKDDDPSDYEMINQPHKFSLYVACGIPVIVWDQSHVATLVKKYGLGICVPNLESIPDAISKVTPSDYEAARNAAIEVADQLRRGHFLNTALDMALQNYEQRYNA